MATRSLLCCSSIYRNKNHVQRSLVDAVGPLIATQGLLNTAFGVTCIATLRGKGRFFFKKKKVMDRTRPAGWKLTDWNPVVTSHDPRDYIKPFVLKQPYEDVGQNRSGNRDGPVRNYKAPKVYQEIEFPAKNRLSIKPKTPLIANPQAKVSKLPRNIVEMRGPELIHNKLKHKQFGIQAMQGGSLKAGHFEMIRNGINRKMDEKRMFAVWRVDAPWKPMTKKGVGHKLGCGKGAIDHYITPIKKDRIIIEMGGYCEWEEVEPILDRVAEKLPFAARIVTQQTLEHEAEEVKRFEENNINPFTFEYCLKNNFSGSRIWASKYDLMWFNKYR